MKKAVEIGRTNAKLLKLRLDAPLHDPDRQIEQIVFGVLKSSQAFLIL